MASDLPLQPTNAIDWNDIGFKVREVNGHVECHYSNEIGGWTEPQFVTDPFLRIHGMAPGLNYGQQCYEGLKAFRQPSGQIALFRPAMNAERLQHSAGFVSMPAVPTELFGRCCQLAVARNAEFVPPHETGAGMYVRPLLFGSSAQLGLSRPEEYTFVVYVMPVGVYHGHQMVKALVLEEFDRAAPEGTGSAKVGGNYAPVLRWSEKAGAEDFGITLHLDSRTRTSIDEFSTSAFIGVRRRSDEDVAVVVSDSKSVIQSITADSVCVIARHFGWRVEKRTIPYSELHTFTEVLAAGTAASLVPVSSITLRSKQDVFEYHDGKDQPGPVYRKLLRTLKDIQLGIAEDQFSWREIVQSRSITI